MTNQDEEGALVAPDAHAEEGARRPGRPCLYPGGMSQVSFRLPNAYIEKSGELAVMLGVTKSDLFHEAIEAWLREYGCIK